MTDYKQLCTELLRAWEDAPTPSDFVDTQGYGTIQKIRAELAYPERQPTFVELPMPTPKAQAEDHPITPPSELVDKWVAMLEYCEDIDVFTDVARWGADQELEACCEWLDQNTGRWDLLAELRAARRPKPPSLKEQALSLIDSNSPYLDDDAMSTIRRALEQLDD